MRFSPRAALRRPARWLGFVIASSTVCSAALATPPSLGLSGDGAYVLDARAKVAWPRCVEGMQWNGKTCVGTALLLSRDEAMALARDLERKRGLHLRVPRITELQGLVDKTASPPGLDPTLFPASPRGWHWSGTSSVNTAPVNQYNYGNIMQGRTAQSALHLRFLEGWAVNLSTGEAHADVTKRTKLPVRLALPLD